LGIFSPTARKSYARERKRNGDQRRINPLILFKMPVLQQLFNLSDDDTEFQIKDRRSFEEFAGLGVINDIPDATTIPFLEKGFVRLEQSKSCLKSLKPISGPKVSKPLAGR